MLPLEQRGEQIDGLLNEATKIVQDWDDRLAFDNLAIAQRYLANELRIMVQWRISDGGGDAPDLLAIYEREPPLLDRQLKARYGRWVSVRHKRYENSGLSQTEDNEEVVFVVRVETIETPEASIPSLVGLQLLEDAERFWTGSVYQGQTVGFKRFLRPAYRKHRVVAGLSSACIHELTSEQIERRAEVVDNITDHRGKPRWWILTNADAIDLVSRCRFVLHEDFVGFSIEERAEASVELVEMFFGPFEFRSRPEQSLAHALTSP